MTTSHEIDALFDTTYIVEISPPHRPGSMVRLEYKAYDLEEDAEDFAESVEFNPDTGDETGVACFIVAVKPPLGYDDEETLAEAFARGVPVK